MVEKSDMDLIPIKRIRWKLFRVQTKYSDDVEYTDTYCGFVGKYKMFTISYVSEDEVLKANVYVKKKKLQTPSGYALTSSHMIVMVDGLKSVKQAKIIARQKLIDYVHGFIK